MQDQPKTEYIAALFARIARHYDLMNDVMTAGRHRVWRKQVAELASAGDGGVALDACCGTGDMTMALARRGMTAVGVDLCPPMLHLAQRKAQRSGLGDRARFQLGDALSLPFRDCTFDCATMGFSMRNVSSIPGCLAEVRRVLKPGGRLVNLDLTLPGSAPAATWSGLYLGWVVPLMAALVAREFGAYRYLPRSLDGFPSAQALADLMRQAGFRDVKYGKLALGAVAIHLGQRQ